MVKFYPQQVVALAVGDAHNPGSQVARTLGYGGRSGQRSTRNFQRNLRCWPKNAMHGYQCSSGRDIQGSGELEEVFSGLVATSHKYRDGKGQPDPLAAFNCLFALFQDPRPFLVSIAPPSRI
jgi:hypothetical protein